MDWFLYDNGLPHERVNYLEVLVKYFTLCSILSLRLIQPLWKIHVIA